MEIDNEYPANEDATQEGEEAFDFWSDEGARRFNEIIDEGSDYILANPHFAENFEEDIYDEEYDRLDPNLHDPDEETLTPGEMEIILENCCIN